MKVISLRKFNPSPGTTYDFNLNRNSNYTLASPTSVYFTVFYRTSTGDFWKPLGDSTSLSPKGTTLIEEIFATPIRDIKQIQLKIQGGYIKGNVSINDFGLFYRKYRGSSVGTLDE